MLYLSNERLTLTGDLLALHWLQHCNKSNIKQNEKVLPKIINTDQTGFIKGRYISENIRIIFDTIDYQNKQNKPGLLFLAYFEKAYDSINHKYMFKGLEKMNFGQYIIRWVQLFYTDITSVIINNGHLFEAFNIEKGVRQGCPLST